MSEWPLHGTLKTLYCLSLRFKPHADPSPETSVSQVAQRGCEELQSDRGNLGKCTD